MTQTQRYWTREVTNMALVLLPLSNNKRTTNMDVNILMIKQYSRYQSYKLHTVQPFPLSVDDSFATKRQWVAQTVFGVPYSKYEQRTKIWIYIFCSCVLPNAVEGRQRIRYKIVVRSESLIHWRSWNQRLQAVSTCCRLPVWNPSVYSDGHPNDVWFYRSLYSRILWQISSCMLAVMFKHHIISTAAHREHNKVHEDMSLKLCLGFSNFMIFDLSTPSPHPRARCKKSSTQCWRAEKQGERLFLKVYQSAGLSVFLLGQVIFGVGCFSLCHSPLCLSEIRRHSQPWTWSPLIHQGAWCIRDVISTGHHQTSTVSTSTE